MDGLSALPWTARWCQGTLPCPLVPNPSIRGVGAPMDGLSALPWTARWCQGTLPCLVKRIPIALFVALPRDSKTGVSSRGFQCDEQPDQGNSNRERELVPYFQQQHVWPD